MLVLTRRLDEAIAVGDHVLVRIVDIRGDSVRVGIDAPSEIIVDRLEVRESPAYVRPAPRPKKNGDARRVRGDGPRRAIKGLIDRADPATLARVAAALGYEMEVPHAR